MKKLYLFTWITLCSFLGLAQPANDAICSATSLTPGAGCTSGTNVGATNAGTPGTPTCWASVPSHDVWYVFSATNDSMQVSTDYVGDGSGDLTDSQISVYSSSDNTCTGTLTQVGCDEDGGTTVSLNSEVSMTTLIPGNTYYVRVDGFSTSTGDYCIGVLNTLKPNEAWGSTCALAQIAYPSSAACAASNGNIIYNATTGWTNTVGADYCGCDNETSQQGSWTTFTANATTTTVTNETAGGNATPIDYTLFTGDCSTGLTCISCTSVAKGGSVTYTTTVGTKYYLLTTLQGSVTSETRTDHCITSTAPCTPPTNNNCATATSITANTVITATTACATPDDALCAGSTENNIWYSWTVPATWSGNTYFNLYNQNCISGPASGGSQVSVYSANQTCATTSSCVVTSNTANDEDITIGFTPTAGATYLITFDGQGGEACTMNFEISNVPVPLPIELLDFNALYNGETVDITWTTASELDNDYFCVQKSTNGTHFRTIDTVDGAGDSQQVLNYTSKDGSPEKGVIYYRLKQTDFNGTNSVSPVVAVDINSLSKFKMLPNPAKETVNIFYSLRNKEELEIQVVDVTGKLLIVKNVSGEKGLNSTFIELNEFDKGVYFINLRGTYTNETGKLVKE